MKKFVVFLLIAALMISIVGCKGKEQEMAPETTLAVTEATTVPTTEPITEPSTEPPTEPAPQCMDVRVMADAVPVVQAFLSYGEQVEILGEADEEHYIVLAGEKYGFVEKRTLRYLSQGDYESWTGYAKSNAAVYSNYQMFGEPDQNLSKNTELTIMEELDTCYVILQEDALGYVLKEEVSESYIRSSSGGSSSGSSSGGGSSGGGSSGGGSSSGGSSSGADGGDITLSFGGIVQLSSVQVAVETGPARVVVHEVPMLLGHYYFGNVVPVVVEEDYAPAMEGYYIVYLENGYAYLPQKYTQTMDQEYTVWEGFAAKNAYAYDNFLLQGDGEKLSVNTPVTVIWDNGEFYLVSIDGRIAYMQLDAVSQEEIKVSSGSSSSGGSSGGSSSGGSSSGGSSSGGSSSGDSSGGEWTPPAL